MRFVQTGYWRSAVSEAPYGFDCLRLQAARKEGGLTVAEIARAAGASDRAVSFYLSGQRHPRPEVLARLARAVGVDDPLGLCDLPKDGERIIHLRVRVGKSRVTVAAELGWHSETYREWESRGHAPDKMAGPRDGWEDDPRRPGWGWRVSTPFFTRPMIEKGASIDGTWRPPVYGPHEYSKPEHEGVFVVPAERLHQALQRTRADWEAACRQWNRENPDFAAELAQLAEYARR
ncbi:helix-turn-helix domain-containing protein [Streptomyces lateritius]|uniref:Helix-turn-helix domain-containing protein n=1 Tax=Streptomyces lateritius TaxID=67313 RepID=A0ABW6YJI5_9ACTN